MYNIQYLYRGCFSCKNLRASAGCEFDAHKKNIKKCSLKCDKKKIGKMQNHHDLKIKAVDKGAS